jgi:uncharacterized HAD superfamily protein
MKVYLDIDDVIFNWHKAYANRFNTNTPKSFLNSNLMKKRLDILSKEKDFWLNLPVKNIPNFQPSGYVSARSIPKSWTIESLKINNIPGRSNVKQVHWGQSKLQLLEDLKCDIFIDDKVQTFRELNKNGIFCLLMDANHNRNVKTKYRIKNLDIENILSMYYKLNIGKS